MSESSGLISLEAKTAALFQLRPETLAAPDTINTMPEKTLLGFADHGNVHGVMTDDGGDAEAVLRQFASAGVDVAALAKQLQREGAESFEKSWKSLLARIAQKRSER